MYYSSIAILSLLVIVIINYDVLIKSSSENVIPAHRAYKYFLYSLLLYYVNDIIWEPLSVSKIKLIPFIQTELYFAIMALTVLLWTQYIIAYLNKTTSFAKFLKCIGWLFISIQIIVLIINCFYPIAFWFDENGKYHTSIARTINLAFQILLYLIIDFRMLIVTLRSDGKIKYRHRAIGIFCLVMTIFVSLGAFYPYMPFYSIGYLLGTCLLHTFVLEDEKETRRQELEYLIQIEHLQEVEIGSTRQLAFTDPLTSIKNKMAYMEDSSGIERRMKDGIIKHFGIAVFDVNNLKIINDTKGHDEGDKLIKEACMIICRQFKHSPVYRIGGDEFAAFLDGEDFENREKLLQSFNNTIEKNKTEGKVTVACGFSEYDPKKDKKYDSIFERADKNMYERKHQLKEMH